MRVLSVAMIGAGNIAGGYDQKRREGATGIFSHAGAFIENGKFSLTSVFDIDHKQAKVFQSDWGVESIISSVSDICNCFHDVISVCTPDDTHYEIVTQLLKARCCRVVFVEKPAAWSAVEIKQLEKLAKMAGIEVVVNFQRRNESSHQLLREQICEAPENLLSVGGYYIKGLRHIGITMIDALTFLLDFPKAVMAYSRTYNCEVDDYSYEFILFYDTFNVSVRTTDVNRDKYHYHIFEIDLLFSDRRVTIIDNSRVVREVGFGEHAYSGVKVLDDGNPKLIETQMTRSMADAVEYVHQVASGKCAHTINTLADSYSNARIVERVIESFDRGSIKLKLEFHS